jgi:glycerol-3-phosphate dehydrogenase (NAD(P)+)
MAGHSVKEEHVAVIGAGSWGTSLAHRVAMKGYPVWMWVRRPELAKEITETRKNPQYTADYDIHTGVETTTDLEQAAQAKTIIMAVPSKGFREMSRKLGDILQPDQILLSATKGIEPGTYLRMTDILKEETSCLKVGAISGPNLALEVMADHPTATIVASRFDEVVEAGMRALNHTTFRAYGSHDLAGVELAGALKNIFAIASGIITGIGYGANTRSFLMSRGLSEMIRLGQHYHVDPMTISGLAGVGDLSVTCSSEKSRNFRVGQRIGRGESVQDILQSMHQVAEGVRTSRAAYDLAKRHKEELPIVNAVYKIVHEHMPLKDAQLELLGRPMHFEHEHKRVIHDPLPPVYRP